MVKPKLYQRFIRFILEKFGIIETVAVSKKQMCENAQSICSHNCNSCAWYEVVEE